MVSPLITISHITKRFGGVHALEDISFDVIPGEFHCICGENGAGKSTLMKILSGVITDYEGELFVRDKAVQFTGTKEAEEAGIGIIHQELNLVEDLSIAANIFLGREKKTAFGFLDDRQMEEEAQKLFEQLDCEISPRQKVGNLRVGDQQLVEIAKAISLKTKILIMDEPTSALTETEVERLFQVIDQLRSQGVTILYISHKMEEIFRLADRITVFRDGKLVKTLTRSETSAREVTHLMVGREIELGQFANDRAPGKTILEVRNLSLPWPGHARKWRLENINFDLKKGEVLGIAGLMGAGRTELLETLFGSSEEIPSGDIILNGKKVLFQSPSEACEAGLALVTEDRKRLGLFDHMTVRDNITICTLSDSVQFGLISSRKETREATDSIELLNIRTSGPEAAVSSLSGGNQQKCIIARWLKTNPEILLLDDPTRGIDVGAKAEIYEVIDQLCKQGLGLIVTSSELPELITLCDRILVLCEGRLTKELQRNEFSEEAIMEAATTIST